MQKDLKALHRLVKSGGFSLRDDSRSAPILNECAGIFERSISTFETIWRSGNQMQLLWARAVEAVPVHLRNVDVMSEVNP